MCDDYYHPVDADGARGWLSLPGRIGVHPAVGSPAVRGPAVRYFSARNPSWTEHLHREPSSKSDNRDLRDRYYIWNQRVMWVIITIIYQDNSEG